MIKLFAAVLCLGLAVLPGVAEGQDPAVQLKPGVLLLVSQEGQSASGSPSLVHAWDRKGKRPSLVFRKQSEIHAFAVGRNGQQYYLNHSGTSIMQADKAGANEKVIFSHKTYVRELALDNDDNVYFSESSGTGADGRIYRVRPGTKLLLAITKDKGTSGAPVTKPAEPKGEKGTEEQAPVSAEPVCTVPLQHMKAGLGTGYWAGNFAFGRDARGMVDTNTLYLTSGNSGPGGAIFRMKRKNGIWSQPQPVFVSNLCIEALVFTNPGQAYFVGHTTRAGDVARVFRLTDLRKVEVVGPLDLGWVWHLSVVPRPGGEKSSKKK
jgi:hypothetical protein